MNNFMEQTIQVFVAAGGVFGLSVWIFKEGLLAIVDREVKKDIEKYKSAG